MADPLPLPHPPRVAVKPKRAIRKARHSKTKNHKRATAIKKALHGIT